MDGSRSAVKRPASRGAIGARAGGRDIPSAPRADEAMLMSASLAGHGTLVRLRAGQKLMRGPDETDSQLVARRGVFILQAEWPGRQPAILSLHYPGDVLPASALPPGCEASIMAATTSEILKFATPHATNGHGGDAPLQDWMTRSLLEQQIRAAVHTEIITSLDANERVASLFMEFALRLGQKTAQGFVLEVPLSRQMMAGYLGLNADTMSRIVSAMKAKAIFDQISRHRYVIRDWRALCHLSPVSATLEAMHGG